MTDIPDWLIPDDDVTIGGNRQGPWQTEPATLPDHWAPLGFQAVSKDDAIECPGCSSMVVAKKPLESAPWIDHEIVAWRCSDCLELAYVVDGDPNVPISDVIDEPFEIAVALADPSANMRIWQRNGDQR